MPMIRDRARIIEPGLLHFVRNDDLCKDLFFKVPVPGMKVSEGTPQGAGVI